MSDYIPDSAENLQIWASNLLDEIALQAAALGWSPAQLAAFQASVAGIRDDATATVQKQNELDTATGLLRQRLAQTLPDLRQTVANIKTLPGYNAGIGAALGITTTPETFDPATYKPLLRAAVFPGHVRLTGKKLGAGSLNIQTRIQGQTPWRLLASKRARFPFDDDTPLATPGTPEVREYRAIGVIGDDKIGQPSDIVTATFPG